MSSETKENLRIAEAARSVFYIPLLAVVAGGFLEEEGYTGVLGPKPAKGAARLEQLIRDEVQVLGNTPTLSFLWLEQGKGPDMPKQVAAVNNRDGFFLVGREPVQDFAWTDLHGAGVVSSSFSLQPWASLRMCLSQVEGLDLGSIQLIDDYPSMGEAAEAFREGRGDFVHLQEPLVSKLIQEGAGHLAASVGEALGALAFSTLAMSNSFLRDRPEAAEAFMKAYFRSLRWLEASEPELIAGTVQPLFESTSKSLLVTAIERYKRLGTWQSNPVISEASYERMVDMWIQAGHMEKRPPFDLVVDNSLARKVRDSNG